MSEVKKVNVGTALDKPLALVHRGGSVLSEQFEKHSISEKFSKAKEHPTLAKVAKFAEVIWTILGFALIFHGAQFKNLFLCTQVIRAFCYDRVKGSLLAVYSDARTAWEKINADADEGDESKADAKAEAKPENLSKHAQKRKEAQQRKDAAGATNEEAIATTKKVLKTMDSDKATSIALELCLAAMACHMVMEGGLARAVVVTFTLVKAIKEQIVAFLDFSEHEDIDEWTNIFLSFVFYVFFGLMAVLAPSLAFALNVATVGATLVSQHGLLVAEDMKRIPGGLSAEAFGTSAKGHALLGGLAVFGTIWQFWALMADNGMGWYFKLAYAPAYMAECIISLF